MLLSDDSDGENKAAVCQLRVLKTFRGGKRDGLNQSVERSRAVRIETELRIVRDI